MVPVPEQDQGQGQVLVSVETMVQVLESGRRPVLVQVSEPEPLAARVPQMPGAYQ